MAKSLSSLVEYFLLGRVGPGEQQRFTQDAGIVADVWLTFAEDLYRPHRVLLTPTDGMPAIDTAAVIHEGLWAYRRRLAGDDPPEPLLNDPQLNDPTVTRKSPNVAPLENFVSVNLYFDELLRVVLPLTQWWKSKDLQNIQVREVRPDARTALEAYIVVQLGRPQREGSPDAPPPPDRSPELRQRSIGRVLEATSIAALIGLLVLVAKRPELKVEIEIACETEAGRSKWISDHADEIAKAAMQELGHPADDAIEEALAATERKTEIADWALIQRVFLDRATQLADAEAICTVKADAADRVFNISCKSLTWAIIDSGVAQQHPAFAEYRTLPDGTCERTGLNRVRATYDLTLIERIRNFDLCMPDPSHMETVILDIIDDLKTLPGQRVDNFEVVADANLRLIGAQLQRRLLPDWALIEPLMRIVSDDGADLSSDHGTHVAGILGGDWREAPAGSPPGTPGEVMLQGVCPDISLYDLRVLHPRSVKSTEFAVIAALEFVRYVNGRASGPPVIHGVNISLSIPHEVRNYACGVTPICVACDDLVQSGVVVVAAAGNRGWNERELGFGNFVFCSITDPGNAQRVITVGATHRLKPHTYGVSYFSSRGPTGDGRMKPDLVAPGEKIRGPIRGGADDELDGTSMAAPFVSGAAAMLMARNRELMRNPQRIKEILCNSATDLGRERYFQGHGLVDVLRALQSI